MYTKKDQHMCLLTIILILFEISSHFSQYIFEITGFLFVICWLMYCWFSADWRTADPLLTDVLLVLCWLITAGPLMTDEQYSWSYADWCTAGPLLTDAQCTCTLHSTVGPLPQVLCWLMYLTAGPMLTDVPLVLCWLMYRWSCADWCTSDPLLTDVLVLYRWSTAACCPASLLLTDAMCVIGSVLKWPGIFTEFSVIHSKCTKMLT